MKQKIAQRILIDRSTDFFNTLIKYKVVNKKQIYKDNNERYYQCDELHGQWQVYNRLGFHIGVRDKNGINIGQGVAGRKIKLN